MTPLARSWLRLSSSLLGLGLCSLQNAARGARMEFSPLDPVLSAAEDRLEKTARGIFRAGDDLQSGLIDVITSAHSPRLERRLSRAWRDLDRSWRS